MVFCCTYVGGKKIRQLQPSFYTETCAQVGLRAPKKTNFINKTFLRLSWHDAEITLITGAQKNPGAGAAASGDLPTKGLAPRYVFAGGSVSPARRPASPGNESHKYVQERT